MDAPIEIFDVCYRMEMHAGACNDLWRIAGYAPTHPLSDMGHIFTSAPMEFDEETLLLKTRSGRLYKIMSFEGDRQATIDQIKSDIIRGGFERH